MENQNRDEDDRHRYSGLYGFDYGNLEGYDIILNTNEKEPDASENLGKTNENVLESDKEKILKVLVKDFKIDGKMSLEKQIEFIIESLA